VTYFHEEQSFRQWWLPVLLAVVALPVVVVLAVRGPVLEVLVIPLVVLAIGALFALRASSSTSTAKRSRSRSTSSGRSVG